MAHQLGGASNPYRGRKGSQGLFIGANGQAADFASFVTRFHYNMGPFNQVSTAEYYPFIERKPFPTISNIREFFSDNTSVEQGLIKLESTGDLEFIQTRDYGRYLPGLLALAGIAYQIDTDENGDIPSDAYVRVGYFIDDEAGEGDGFGLLLEDGVWYSFVLNAGEYQYKKPQSEWLDTLDGSGDENNPSGKKIDLNRSILRLPFLWYGLGHIAYTLTNFDREEGDSIVLADRNEVPDEGATIRYPDLPITAEAKNCTLRVGGRHFGVFGKYTPFYRNTTAIQNNLETVDDASWTSLLSFIKKPETIWRGVPVKVTSFSLETSDSVLWKIVVDPTFVDDVSDGDYVEPEGYEGETAVLYNDSPVEITGGTTIAQNFVTYDPQQGGSPNLLESTTIPEINISGDVTVVLAVKALGDSSDVRSSLTIREEF